MSKKLFYILFIFSFWFPNCAFSEDIDFSLLGERSLKDFKENKSYQEFVYEGNYASIFASREAKKRVKSWVGISEYKYRLNSSSNEGNMLGETEYFTLKNDYSDSDNHKFVLKVIFPHPKFEEQAKYGLFPLYMKLDNVKQTLAQKEKIVVQNKYPATIYEFKDKTCSIQINMPRQVRVYLNGACKDKAVLLDFYEKLSLDKLKEKISE